MAARIRSQDKCSKCGTEESDVFWDYDDGSVLCDKCEKESKKKKEHVERTPNLIYRPAGFWRRFFAFIIDLTIFYGIIGLMFVLVSSLPQLSIVFGIIAAIVFALFLGRDYFFEGKGVGKNIMGLKVVEYDNQSKGCSFWSSVVRTFILLLCLIVRILSIWIAYDVVFSKEKRRAGDGLSNTVVVLRDQKMDPSLGLNQLKSFSEGKHVKSRTYANQCDQCGEITTKDLWDMDDGSVICNKCYTGKKVNSRALFITKLV